MFAAIGRLMGRGLRKGGEALVSLARRSRAVALILVIVCVLFVGFLVDAGINGNRIYAGVTVGEVDVSGMTREEAQSAIVQRYAPAINAAELTIYASDEAAASANALSDQENLDKAAEQLSVDEMRANKLLWLTNAAALNVVLPSQELADRAFAIGRSEGGLLARLGAALGGTTIDLSLDYGDGLSDLEDDINMTIGSPRVDFGVEIADGVASVTEGENGRLMDSEEFVDRLTRGLISEDPAEQRFVAHVEDAPVRIDSAQAQATCDVINKSIASGIAFSSESSRWAADAATIGQWVTTEIVEQSPNVDAGDPPTGEARGAFILLPKIDEKKAKPALLAHVNDAARVGDIRVSFEVNGDDVTVVPAGDVQTVLSTQAVEGLNEGLFGEAETALARFNESGELDYVGLSAPLSITVENGNISGPVPFDEAIDLGIITKFSSYTTEYANTEYTQNRLFNIHLAADLLNNSVAKADGGQWSFNEVVGECTADKGFLGAGAIVGGEYEDAIGGGICQVATTVFNAVYEAGLPVSERYNHSLYVASYPAGRDAAIAYPYLDLIWVNDTPSDILVRSSYTDTTLTVDLYGVDPGRVVETIEGDWGDGEKHKTRIERDESLAAGTEYVKTYGSDGKTFVVYRNVYDRDGQLIAEDVFYSTYSPTTEVIVKGPDAPATQPAPTNSSEGDVAAPSQGEGSVDGASSNEDGQNDGENAATMAYDGVRPQ